MKIPYKLRNLFNRSRGLPQEFYRIANVRLRSQLSAVHFRGCEYGPTGTLLGYRSREDYGVLSRRLVTTVGVAWLATAFTNTVEAESLNWHDCGTGVGAENASNTALGTAYGGSRASGTQSTPGSTNIYRSVATISFTSTLAITEHGIFTASTSGTLFDRSVFSALNVVNLDSIQFTYELTLPTGG